MIPPSPPRGAGGPAVELRSVRRTFGRVVALDGADLTAQAGEVHGVLGENGAGKTTLFSVLAGLLERDSGEVRVDGAPVRFRTPRDAWRAGIGMVHQHFALVPRLTVLENLALGQRGPGGGFRLRLDRMAERARALASDTGLEVPLDRPLEELGVGDRQRAEILKVLLRDPRVLVLDEPTAVLSPSEVKRLLELLRGLAAEGRAVLIVAHKLDEILAVADRVTVLRDGRTVLEAPRSEVDAHGLAAAMVGPERADRLERAEERAAAPASGGEVVARLEAVRHEGGRGTASLDEVSLEVRRGEVVGVAGVEGNGQRELAAVLAGRLVPEAGATTLPADPAFVPQDRGREGLVPGFTVTENFALALHRDGAYRSGPFLRWGALEARTAQAMASYSIRALGPSTPASSLSGGNQQRVVVARELARDPALVVLESPTRGLDVTGAAFVHDRIRELRAREVGAPGIVLISTDLDEVIALADRVFAMVRGRLLAVPETERTREGIGRRMLAAERA